MTTNSPNPVDGDLQALIERLNRIAARLKWNNVGYAQDVLKAVDLLTAPPAQLLRPVEQNSAKSSELAERAEKIVDDCNSLIRRINATEQRVSDKPSLKAMMHALDAFYADESVPEAAMMKAFKILLADVMPAAAGGQDV